MICIIVMIVKCVLEDMIIIVFGLVIKIIFILKILKKIIFFILGKCIGKGNIWFFYLFLVSTVVYFVSTVIIAVDGLTV